ncbi:hypothetical protein UL54_23035, partial [Shigella dysenteriae]
LCLIRQILTRRFRLYAYEHLRAQIEKLRRMLFGTRSEKLRREVEQAEALLKQREQDSDRYSGREDDPQVPRQLRQSRHRRPLPE